MNKATGLGVGSGLAVGATANDVLRLVLGRAVRLAAVAWESDYLVRLR